MKGLLVHVIWTNIRCILKMKTLSWSGIISIFRRKNKPSSLEYLFLQCWMPPQWPREIWPNTAKRRLASSNFSFCFLGTAFFTICIGVLRMPYWANFSKISAIRVSSWARVTTSTNHGSQKPRATKSNLRSQAPRVIWTYITIPSSKSLQISTLKLRWPWGGAKIVTSWCQFFSRCTR